MPTAVLMPESPPLIDPLADTNALYEIVDGEIVEKPEMGIQANLVTGELYFALRAFLERHPLGTAAVEAMFVLDDEGELKRRPDVAFVSAERWPLARQVPDEGDWEVIPDLAIEVMSPHDTVFGIERKIGEYFACGVRRVWTVHTILEAVVIYTAQTKLTSIGGDAVLTGEDILPGFELPLARLFRRASAPV